MSAPAAAPAGAPGASGGGQLPAPGQSAVPNEACPLCGAPLHPEQEWCLNCGAAARTRLAASPNWKTPLMIVAVVAVLSLGVLAAALVKLAGGSGPQAPATTMTVTTAAAAPAPTTTSTTVPTLSTPATTGAATAPTTSTTTPTTKQHTAKSRAGLIRERLRKLGLFRAKK